MNKINEKQVPDYIQENELLYKIKHPNIAQIIGFQFNDKKVPPSILSERCISNLNQAIESKKLTKVDLSFMIYQIAEGMKYIHSNKIINYNLKPSNILIGSDGLIKISDIGINRIKETQNKRVPFNNDIISLYFIAPEYLQDSEYNEKIDVYSFGILVYFILNEGKLPETSMIELINGKQLKAPSSFTPNAIEIIEYCCNNDPQIRPSFAEIVEYLKNEECVLMDMSKSELADVQSRIKKHHEIIPSY